MVRVRLLVLVLVLVLMCGVALLGAGGPAGAFTATEVSAVWDVSGVGPGGRSLQLVYTTGGCLGPGARASVTESPGSVSIAVTEVAEKPGPGEACALYLGRASLTVRLRAPVAGRAILGRRAKPFPFAGELGAIPLGTSADTLVPRVSGLSPADAARTLALYALHARLKPGMARRGLARVLTQTPAAGTVVGRRSVVVLGVSRP
jgi:hypothetical protein